LSQVSAPAVVGDALRLPGRPLDAATRAYMEPRFGHDFSGVRVHADAVAEQSARSISARAYTVGQDMFFSAGQFAPTTIEGKHLLAHELTHVTQNGISSSEVIRRSPHLGGWPERESGWQVDPVCDGAGHIVSAPDAQAIKASKPCPSTDQRRAMFEADVRDFFNNRDASYEEKMQFLGAWSYYLTANEFEQLQKDHDWVRQRYERYKKYYDPDRPNKPRDFSDLRFSVTYGEDPREVQGRILDNMESNVGGAIGYGIANQFTNDPQRLEGASGLGAGVGDMTLARGGLLEIKAAHPVLDPPRPDISTRFDEGTTHPTASVDSSPTNTAAATDFSPEVRARIEALGVFDIRVWAAVRAQAAARARALQEAAVRVPETTAASQAAIRDADTPAINTSPTGDTKALADSGPIPKPANAPVDMRGRVTETRDIVVRGTDEVDPGLLPDTAKDHVFNGDILGGYHSTARGPNPNVKVVRVKEKPDAQGFYKVKVEIRDPATRQVTVKDSTMFPDNWSESRILEEVSAVVKANPPGAVDALGRSQVTGVSPSGADITIFWEKGEMKSFFPVLRKERR
jgi:Domain of unknown function (DUF4157)/Bacterial EndoU nuclease